MTGIDVLFSRCYYLGYIPAIHILLKLVFITHPYGLGYQTDIASHLKVILVL